MHREQRDVQYEGWVQGVGFRFIVCRIAGGYDVTGYVRNLPDGRVHLVAEGPPAELDGFLSQIQTAMAGHIRDVHVGTRPAAGEFCGFTLRRS